MDEFRRHLQELSEDHSSGAAQLSAQLAPMIVALIERNRDTSENERRLLLQRALHEVADCRPAMAPLYNSSRRLLEALESAISERQDIALDQVLEQERAERLRELEEMCDTGLVAFRLMRRVMLLSRSSTVENVLLRALPADCEFLVCESRPLREGRDLALALQAQNRSVRLISDAAATCVMSDCDAILLGCDAITLPQELSVYHSLPEQGLVKSTYSPADYWIINKTGSAGLVRVAASLGVPVWILATQDKLVDARRTATVSAEVHAGEELWREYPALCHNPVLEAFPAGLVHRFLLGGEVLDHIRLGQRLLMS